MMDPPGAVRVIRVGTNEETLAARDVMFQLRQDMQFEEYLPTVRRMTLYSGRIRYIDDLNTDERHRSRGYGKVDRLAQGRGAQLHLDSGVQREQTHRFYFREGLTINCYHFRVAL